MEMQDCLKSEEENKDGPYMHRKILCIHTLYWMTQACKLGSPGSLCLYGEMRLWHFGADHISLLEVNEDD